ncbi:hypothetical protein BB561_003206 [Smittium simulii]|uniref:Cyclin-like domain-containing protein n=1 Tax=Smittium simulii TaxID=133385 RepID=A0A2T9YMK9_9FUNG|nr:hypothetical protein BB561_006843 [Smittium simulii]PVU93562.1 hypothetical protein BB561_003206 [Smittium simulii]
MQDKYIFEQSSHYRNWRFSKQQLDNLREAINRKGVENAKASKKLELQLKQEDGLDDNSETLTNAVEHISAKEEQLMVAFYETKIKDYVKVYRFNKNIGATAIIYLKRFYLHNTVLDYHPKQIMLTCLFLATKVENYYILIESFTKPLKQISPEDVLKFELLVSQSLGFDFCVKNPYNAIYGYFLDIQEYYDDNSKIAKLYSGVVSLVETSLYTDCGLMFMPSQIALAVWKIAAKDGALDFDMQVTFPNSEQLKDLYSILDQIELIISKHTSPEIGMIREIDKKLIYCRNQAKNPNNIVYKHLMKQAEENKQKELKKTQSIDEDVFS